MNEQNQIIKHRPSLTKPYIVPVERELEIDGYTVSEIYFEETDDLIEAIKIATGQSGCGCLLSYSSLHKTFKKWYAKPDKTPKNNKEGK